MRGVSPLQFVVSVAGDNVDGLKQYLELRSVLRSLPPVREEVRSQADLPVAVTVKAPGPSLASSLDAVWQRTEGYLGPSFDAAAFGAFLAGHATGRGPRRPESAFESNDLLQWLENRYAPPSRRPWGWAEVLWRDVACSQLELLRRLQADTADFQRGTDPQPAALRGGLLKCVERLGTGP